jgi:hypothetical protein
MRMFQRPIATKVLFKIQLGLARDSLNLGASVTMAQTKVTLLVLNLQLGHNPGDEYILLSTELSIKMQMVIHLTPVTLWNL